MAGISGEYIYDEKGKIIGATGGKLAALNSKRSRGDDFFKNIGRKGGSVKGTTGGFASDMIGDDGLTGYERARVVGAKGGRISRRRPVVKEIE